MSDRRLIEESFPVKEVGAISAKEKSIRHGHISTLHIWWARKPLAASRATAYAALVPPANDELDWQKQRDFIVQLSRWENSLNVRLLDKARREILEAHAVRLSAELGHPVTAQDIEDGRAPRPRVLDPFAGGGAIPLEALRLGCETYAGDYNPVAILILKATVEYPRKYGRPVQAEASSDLFGGLVEETHTVNPLLRAVQRWGAWVQQEARKELLHFYPLDPDGSVPVGYYWMRTIPCQNPACRNQIPLTANWWLAKTRKKRVALYPFVGQDGILSYRIVGDGYDPWPEGFDPGDGTVSRAVAACPCCGSVVDANTTRRLFQGGQAGQRMVAVVLARPGQDGKTYRVATEADESVYREVEAVLQAKRERLMPQWGLDPVPDEDAPGTVGSNALGFRYSLHRFGDYFNTRQKLALVTFTANVRQAYKQMIAEETDPGFAAAVVTYLGLAVDRLADYNSTMCVWHSGKEIIAHTFGRQGLQMVWDYIEVDPFSNSTGNWAGAFEYLARVVSHCSRSVSAGSPIPSPTQASAAQLPYPDAHFDAVLTDPPYYDNVNYSVLSDFFYVWLKRTVGYLHPDLFSTPLTPRANEIVSDRYRQGGSEAAKRFFEERIKQAFQEIHRILKPDGITVIVYAHKSTAGWETVTNALLDSGLVMTGAWPLRTEMSARLTAKETAALDSSIYIVARKTARRPAGFYNEVREELRRHLEAKLHRLWEEGIGGADFFIAAIGSAIEVFGRYEQVIDYEGNVVRADRLLEEVRTIATDYAVRQILRDGFAGEVTELTRLYVLWHWNYGEAQVPFDEARKLAQSCGVDLAREWGRGGFVRKEKEFIRLLGPQRRKLEELEDARELIDVLHCVLLLWEKGRREELVQVLASTGYGRSEAFYRVAQAVSETLPNDSREKKLLDGFLVGRERVREEVGKVTQQGRLWE